MRSVSGWRKISNSPNYQNAYHLKMFRRWMTYEIENFASDRVIAPVVFTVAKWVVTTDNNTAKENHSYTTKGHLVPI